MKKLNKYLLAIISLAFVFTACDEEEKLIEQLEDANPIPGPVTGDPGSLNFSKYVAVGNSLTTGFQDNALYDDAILNSYPNLFAQQLQIEGIGGGVFNQAEVNSANGYSGPGADGQPGTADDLGRFELSLSLLAPVPTQGELFGDYTGDKAALNNFGVPGMRAVDLRDPSLAFNPYYGRIASAPGTSTVLGDALNAGPTFFSFWLGNNDVLGYAASGGTGTLSDLGQVQTELTESLTAFASTGAQGVVMTVPLIITAPYFRAIPYNAVPLTEQALVDQLNTGFAGYNAVLSSLAALQLITAEEAAQRTVTYQLGANAILMEDKGLTDITPFLDALVAQGAITDAQKQALLPYVQARQATANDLPLLTLGAVIGGGVIGISLPAPDALVLSEQEVQVVVGQRAAINATIAAVVDGVNTGIGAEVINLIDIQPITVDASGLDAATASFLVNPGTANPYLIEMASNAAAAADGVLGVEVQGVNLAPDFSPNGFFSTDGIHFNPRGAAVVANAMIQTLNSKKGSNIPLIDVLSKRGVLATN